MQDWFCWTILTFIAIFKSEFIKPKSHFFAWLKCPSLDRVKKIIIVIFTKVGKALGNLSFPGLPNSYFYLVLIMPIIGNKDANQMYLEISKYIHTIFIMLWNLENLKTPNKWNKELLQSLGIFINSVSTHWKVGYIFKKKSWIGVKNGKLAASFMDGP